MRLQETIEADNSFPSDSDSNPTMAMAVHIGSRSSSLELNSTAAIIADEQLQSQRPLAPSLWPSFPLPLHRHRPL